MYKEIIGYKNYMVSDSGTVLSTAKNKITELKPKINTHGYFCVNLYNENGCKTKEIHSLVWSAFRGDKNGLTIDHIDNNKRNNSIENLRLITNRENVSKGYLLKNKQSKYIGVRLSGKNTWRASIKENGKRRHLGCFSTEQGAHFAYINELNKITGCQLS